MVSEAVSGGEQRDPDVQAETETNSGSKWGQKFKEGEMQHIGPRGPSNFKPFLGKWLLSAIMWLCQEAVTFVPFLEEWLEQMTDANNNNLSNELHEA